MLHLINSISTSKTSPDRTQNFPNRCGNQGKSPHFRGASSHLPAPQSLSLSHPGGHRLERLRPRATRVPPKIRSRVGCVSLPETKSGSLGMDGFHSKPPTKTGNLMCFEVKPTEIRLHCYISDFYLGCFFTGNP